MIGNQSLDYSLNLNEYLEMKTVNMIYHQFILSYTSFYVNLLIIHQKRIK
jgi:hypothetical protein